MTDPFLKIKPENNNQNQQNANSAPTTKPVNSGNPANQAQMKKVKKGFKLSFKGFMIGCLILFFLIIILTSVALYIILGKPTLLKEYGLPASTIKTLLMTFTVLFFGILFFFGFGLLVMNGYRFFTQQLNKFKYGITAFIGFVLFSSSLVFGVISIYKIRSINSEATFISNNVVDPYIITKENKLDKSIYIGQAPKVIAPAYMEFKINKELFNQKILPEIVSEDRLTGLELDCGNGQILKAGKDILGENPYFRGRCLFVEKKRYELKLKYKYIGKGGLGEQDGMFKVTDLDIDSVMNIIPPENSKITLNDNKSEIIVGLAPTLIQYDASKIFTDLEISGEKIDWDFDGDGEWDAKEKTIQRFNYENADKFDVMFRLPNYAPDFIYFFTVRVQDSDIPPCKITAASKGGFNYNFNIELDKKVKVKKYEYQIFNNETNKVEKTDLTSRTSFSERLPVGGVYTVKLNYTTTDNKQGSCETSSPIDTKVGDYNILPAFYLKLPNDEEYLETSMTGNGIEIPIVPSHVRFEIKKIEPEDEGLKRTVSIDSETLTAIEGDKIYEFDVNEKKNRLLSVILEDDKGRKSEHKYNIVINEKPVIARIKAKPMVGEEPLEVDLDASISMINSEDDEIVYFTWDFGDGEVMENVSQGKLTHTYKFNKDAKDGKYYPKVTVQSKNGHESTYQMKTPILIKRQVRKVQIDIESHPTQIANFGEIVRLGVNTDGDVKKINWDFGNGKNYSCDGRECISTSTTYENPGTYNIKVSVEYNDFPTATNNIKIIIK